MNRKEIKEHHERIRILDVKIRAIKNAVTYEKVKQFVKERPDLIDKIKENYIKKPRTVPGQNYHPPCHAVGK